MKGWLRKSLRTSKKQNTPDSPEIVRSRGNEKKLQCDIVIGLQYGDEGKGKVVDHLIKNNTYTACVRYNGK